MKNEQKVYSVSQVNSYAKRLLEDDFILRNLYIRGELSNCKFAGSGHLYFSLKDENSRIEAVMWSSAASRLSFRPKDGMQVVIRGSVKIYEPFGKYQLYAESMEEAGIGDLARRFEELKKKLSEEGMFSDEYKIPIPSYSMKIGVVTSETGAVIRDIYNVASRRNPYCQILLYPAAVQGEGAAEQIAAGIDFLSRTDVDVIIVGRGGGSIEDLWAFNEEIVARAIFGCPIPVISAVGHETDFTIADFVADRRAPTPSAAAELAVFDYAQFEESLNAYKYTLQLHLNRNLERYKNTVKHYGLKMETLSPANQLIQKKRSLEEKKDRIDYLLSDRLRSVKERLGILSERLYGQSPLKRLSAGYAYVTDEKGQAIKSIKQTERGELLRIHVTDGRIDARTEQTNEVIYE